MRFALIADAFPPLRTSGAVQLRDLSQEFTRQGHEVIVMIAAPDLDVAWRIDRYGDVTALRLKSPRTRDIGYVRRTAAEFLMPIAMLRNYRRSPLAGTAFDGIIWYSPTIFLAPIVNALKRESNCRAYLIIRDIFPQWAADMGLMARGLPYQALERIARRQYATADIIGVQTPGNLAFLDSAAAGNHGARLEVLHNWLSEVGSGRCSINLTAGPLAGRKIFVYAGNMGVAQGMDKLIDLAGRLKDREDIGFLFVGRGSDTKRLACKARRRSLTNVLFHDEIDPDEIPGLYAQCHVGLVSLDPRHKTHNIPGKFLSYMQVGLPVLASVNPGNDLISLIEERGVGRVSVDPSGADLLGAALSLLADIALGNDMPNRCKALSKAMFTSAAAVSQIVAALGAV